ncbi:hypothetical protein [Aeoliella sp. SH292]|uniref:hypothetical protein n=1 Tax=Aeoliella sp. SH292 TaxID=3454464 RepID=UPI003F9DF497
MAARLVGCVLLVLGLLATSLVQAEESSEHLLCGTVVDENDKPVADAMLVLSLRLGLGDDAWKVEGTTNDRGEFELAVPTKWLERGAFYADRTLWVHAPKLAVGSVWAYEQLDKGTGEPLRVKLAPEQPCKFKVTNVAGTPIAECRVRPHHWQSGHIPPDAILDRIAGTTDASGVATVHGLTPKLARNYEVLSPSLGTQVFAVAAEQFTGDLPVQLAMLDAGTLEGQLECDDKSAVANTRVSVYTTGHHGPGSAEGTGVGTTDSEGRFRIDHLAEGLYALHARVPEGATLRPQLPDEVVIRANETTTLNVPYSPTAIVRGQVVARGADKPVGGAFVIVSHGTWRQSESVTTDEEGKFEARVLPGRVRQQLVSMPKQFESWIRVPGSNEMVEVALDSSPVELPPLELRQAQFVEGQLVDAEGEPVVEGIIGAMDGEMQVGYGRTEKDGKFKLQVAENQSITKFVLSVGRMYQLPAEVVSERPLVLRMPDVNKLANITETKSPTPEDKRRPPKSPDQTESQLIVAKNVLIFEGRAMDWAQLAEELEKRAGSKGGDIGSVAYSRTHAVYDDELRTEEARNWSKMLTDMTTVPVQEQGLILNQAAERYDSLQVGDPWPPGAEKPVRGRVVDADGKPVADAQVVLFIPAPSSSRFGGHQSIYLTEGEIQSPEEHIVKRTDKEGNFQFDFPATRANVLALAPEGSALAAAMTDGSDLRLAPWSRVTAEIVQNKKLGEITVSLDINVTPTGGTPAYFHLSMGSPGEASAKAERLAVPSGMKVTARRTIWKEHETGGMMGESHPFPFEFTTEPGRTHHLKFGPIQE